MRPKTSLARFRLVPLILLVLATMAEAGEDGNIGPIPTAPTLYYACISGARLKVYDSAVFAMKNPGPAYSDHSRHLVAMGAAFDDWLLQKYGFRGLASCTGFDTLAKAREWVAEIVRISIQSGSQFTATDWTYNAVPSASEPAAAPTAPAQTIVLSPETAYGYCRSSDARIAYYSASFSSPIYKDSQQQAWDPIKATSVQWRQAYIEFLRKQYAFVGYTQCVGYASQADAQKDFDNMIRLARSAPPGQSVETGWVYRAAAPVAAAPAAATTSAAPARPATKTAARPAPAPVSKPAATATTPAAVSSVHAVCWADFDPANRYYSAVFSGAGSDYSDWMPAFKQFLQQKYRYQGLVRCTKQLTQAEAQNYWNQMVNTARGILLAGGAKPKIIETGWTYKRSV